MRVVRTEHSPQVGHADTGPTGAAVDQAPPASTAPSPDTGQVGVAWVREHGRDGKWTRQRAAEGQMPSLARARRALQQGRIPHVTDALLPGAVQALFATEAAQLAPRHRGMRIETLPAEASDQVRLELFYSPHRQAPAGTKELAPVASPIAGAHATRPCADCPFCGPPLRGHSLQWRGLRVLPNAFPYVRSESQHLLLLPVDHREQNFEPSFFRDVLALQRRLGPSTRVHFNGKAGNSQPHLHWHAHQEPLPLEQKLGIARSQLDELLRLGDATLSSYAFSPLRGLLLEGSEDDVTRLAQRVVDVLEADPTVQGRYNMVLLQRLTEAPDRVRLVIAPRRSDTLSLEVPGVGVVKGGALDAVGRRTVSAASVSDEEIAAWRLFLERTLVPADEIPGLRTLVEENDSTCPPSVYSPWQTRISD